MYREILLNYKVKYGDHLLYIRRKTNKSKASIRKQFYKEKKMSICKMKGRKLGKRQSIYYDPIVGKMNNIRKMVKQPNIQERRRRACILIQAVFRGIHVRRINRELYEYDLECSEF
jgi:hypothetical protein